MYLLTCRVSINPLPRRCVRQPCEWVLCHPDSHRDRLRRATEQKQISCKLSYARKATNNLTRRCLLHHFYLPPMGSLKAQTNSYDLVYNWFGHLKSKGHYIAGYVIMPNHVHALIAFRNTSQSIETIIGNGKRFIAYKTIKRLKHQKENKLLHQLHLSVEAKDLERNKKHEVWQDSFDWKECRTNEYMQQKLDYMYDNPCKGKWNLAASPVDYKDS
jgi:REP element-mobilizing transposase RayT